jgi:hypothetical protein
MTILEAYDLVTILAGRGGVKGDIVNFNLILSLINAKFDDTMTDIGMDTQDFILETNGTDIEYDLPNTVIPKRVTIDGIQSEAISYTEAREILFKDE